MSDEELCKALRSALWGQGHHINIKAADRIEELERERDELFAENAKNSAKLTKAVDALQAADLYICDLQAHEGAEGFSVSTAEAAAVYHKALVELEKQ
jgi:hypothetical protein